MPGGERYYGEKVSRPGSAPDYSAFRQTRDCGLLRGDTFEEFFYL